jgi:hypothetical protein
LVGRHGSKVGTEEGHDVPAHILLREVDVSLRDCCPQTLIG